jgi:HK97 gp10 family phage protein
MPVEWNGDRFLAEVDENLSANLEKAAIYFKGKVKEALNRSQPYERYKGEKGVYYHGEDPSQPGEAPKKITGFLQRSIAHAMSGDKKQAFVGTNLDYGLYLETGTVKMAARPFLRSTLLKEREKIARIIATGRG